MHFGIVSDGSCAVRNRLAFRKFADACFSDSKHDAALALDNSSLLYLHGYFLARKLCWKTLASSSSVNLSVTCFMRSSSTLSSGLVIIFVVPYCR